MTENKILIHKATFINSTLSFLMMVILFNPEHRSLTSIRGDDILEYSKHGQRKKRVGACWAVFIQCNYKCSI